MNLEDKVIIFKFTDDIKINLESKQNIKNFIADLSNFNFHKIESIKEKFLTFDEMISKINGSFVVVSNIIFDDNLVIVPTLQEAYDYIEMEEIQRELNL